MTNTYKVTGHKVILGVGITLKLTEAQSSTRNHSLKQKKKGIYTVLESVEFKQGEIVTIVSGNISKAVLENLEKLVLVLLLEILSILRLTQIIKQTLVLAQKKFLLLIPPLDRFLRLLIILFLLLRWLAALTAT